MLNTVSTTARRESHYWQLVHCTASTVTRLLTAAQPEPQVSQQTSLSHHTNAAFLCCRKYYNHAHKNLQNLFKKSLKLNNNKLIKHTFEYIMFILKKHKTQQNTVHVVFLPLNPQFSHSVLISKFPPRENKSHFLICQIAPYSINNSEYTHNK